MTVLTAYNSEVQKWTAPPSKTAKITRLATFKAKFEGIFEAVFTNAREQVLDHIIYLASTTGICTIKGETLADKAGVKIRTVRAAVKSLKESNQFVIAQTANGRCGAYIFIDKEHENYATIMKDLFDIEVDNAQPDAQHDAPSDAHHENPENVGMTEVAEENNEPIFNIPSLPSLKDLKPKQESPVNLYGKVCKLLKIVGKNSLVTKLVRMCEKAKNEIINFTDDHFMYALQESVNYGANDLAAYTASIIYNTKQSNTSYSKPAKQVDESKLPRWYKEGKHKQHVTAEQEENDPELEEQRQALLAQLGY